MTLLRSTPLALAWFLLPFLAVLDGCKSPLSSHGPQVLWQFTADNGIISTPALAADGTIYFTTAKFLYALSPEGKQKWQYFPGAEIATSPVVGPDGAIYIADNQCVLHALNVDGTTRHVSPLSPSVPGAMHQESCWRPTTPTVAADNLLYISNFDGSLLALDPTSGETTDRFHEVGGQSSPEVPVIGKAVEGGGALQFFDSDGHVDWTIRLDRLTFRTPAITANGVIAVAGWDGKLHVYDFSGRPQWEFLGDWLPDPVISTDGTIYVGNSDEIVALRSDGTVLWRVPIQIPGSLALADDGTVYVSAQDLGKGKDGRTLFGLYAVGKKGEIKWHLPVDALIKHGPTIAPDGTIYFGTLNGGAPGVKANVGTLYAIRENNGGLMRGGWPKSYGSPANDGRAPTAP